MPRCWTPASGSSSGSIGSWVTGLSTTLVTGSSSGSSLGSRRCSSDSTCEMARRSSAAGGSLDPLGSQPPGMSRPSATPTSAPGRWLRSDKARIASTIARPYVSAPIVNAISGPFLIPADGALGLVGVVGTPRKIRVVGDPVLHAPTRQVTEFDDSLATLIDDMFASLAVAEGVGLAAPQIGVDLAVFVYDCPDETGTRQIGHVVNPTITTSGALDESEEGCLSVPGPYHDLARYWNATVRGVDKTGAPVEVSRHRLPRPLPAARDRPPARHALHRPPAAQPPPPGAARDGAVRVERAARNAARRAVRRSGRR